MKKGYEELFVRFPQFCEKGTSFECGEGWYEIIYNYLEQLEYVCNLAKIKRLPIMVLKEKFGVIRLYQAQPKNEMLSNVINAMQHDLEFASKRVCEQCGAVGSYRNKSWLRVSCDDCEAKMFGGRNDI